LLLKLNSHIVKDIILDDPVRPHIEAEWRTRSGREVYGLYADESFEELRAVICVAYTDEVPTCERDLGWVADHIKKTNPDVKRFVTLSPLTEMAKNFHLKNGAKFLRKHMDCQNFEY
jgi:hypothetical protein